MSCQVFDLVVGVNPDINRLIRGLIREKSGSQLNPPLIPPLLLLWQGHYGPVAGGGSRDREAAGKHTTLAQWGRDSVGRMPIWSIYI